MPEKRSLSSSVTGEEVREREEKIIYRFDRYEIEILVTESGKFIGVTGVGINKDFLSQAQKITRAKYFDDVEDYYREEEKK